MHFWSKFGKPHFIWYWLIARTNSQAKNGVNFDFQVQFDLEDHRQSPHKTIGILIKVFYISDPNLVILAWTADELLHGQADDWRTDTRTHTHTHAGNDNTRRPKLASGKNEFWYDVGKFHDVRRRLKVEVAFAFCETHWTWIKRWVSHYETVFLTKLNSDFE